VTVKKWLLLFLLLAAPASAQVRSANFGVRYDLDDAALTYCRVTGVGGDPYGAARQVPGKLIETSGSSTTVTAVTAGALPFADLNVNDIIFVRTSTTNVDMRVVAAKADGDGITVDTAVDWSAGDGFQFTWYDTACGTAATDGWIDMSALSEDKTIEISWDQGDLATGLLWQIECLSGGLDPKPNKVYPGDSSDCGAGALTSGQCLYAVAGVGTTATRDKIWLPEFESACRVGILRSGNDTSDTTTNREQVSMSVRGSTRR
jgi:hypothetical protein